MSVIAVIGDCTTTTCLALAAAWPVSDEVVIIEADRSGGSLAAWLDTPTTPSLSTIVANAPTVDHPRGSATWPTIDSMIQTSPSGVRFIAAPVRSREAQRAIGEAESALFPTLAARTDTTMLADLGRLMSTDEVPQLVGSAEAIVVCHRQDRSSAGAATVRLERLAELVGVLDPLGVPMWLAIVGDRPFDIDEITRFVTPQGHRLRTHLLPVDELSAAVFAGRRGVSARRLARLPLMRAARSIVHSIRDDQPRPLRSRSWLTAGGQMP